MSLSIDSRLVSGVYAFDRWFVCVVGSVCVDAYEFFYWQDRFPVGESTFNEPATVYQMADAYPEVPSPGDYLRLNDNVTSPWQFSSPSACNGIQFQEEDTGALVSFSLIEVKAFRSRPADEYRGQVL